MGEAQKVQVYWLGRIGYQRCWDLQRSLVEAVSSGELSESLLLLEHDPVFTIGRRGANSSLRWSQEHCAERGVEVIWSDRGGDATYHGPGQLVGYPILDLRRRGIDVITYVRHLEFSLIAYLGSLGVEAEPGGKGMTGVWSWANRNGERQREKVAAIGLKLNRSITSHGFALNLTSDLDTFNQGIVPCGLEGKRATSVAALAGAVVTVEQAARDYKRCFALQFGVGLTPGDPEQLAEIEAQPPVSADSAHVAVSLQSVEPAGD
jgi:lipoyl(octanoyl) transferase